MSYIYVFDSDYDGDDSNYETMGLAGALMPTECVFKEEANGESSITLKHPIDSYGKYKNLQRGNILTVPVPVNTDPTKFSDPENTRIWKYTVKPKEQLTSDKQRTLYKAKTGNSSFAVLKHGTVVTVLEKSDDSNARWKVDPKGYSEGWMDPMGLDLDNEETAASYKEASWLNSSWELKTQCFRIYDAAAKLDGIEVKARHITYDLLYNITSYSSKNNHSCSYVLGKVMDESFNRNPFELKTNLSTADEYKYTGFEYAGKNIIDILFNDTDGICTIWNLYVIRNGSSISLVTDPGQNRGISIDYGRNMTGIDFTINEEDVVTRVIPVGETKDGDPLYLSDTKSHCYVDSPLINSYAVPHCYELKCDNCKVGEKEGSNEVTTEIARERMQAQAEEFLETKPDVPDIQIKVDYQPLGETEQYAYLKGLEELYLYDYVTINCPQLSYIDENGVQKTVSTLGRVISIEWDCILDRMKTIEIGKVLTNYGSEVNPNTDSPNMFGSAEQRWTKLSNRKSLSNVIKWIGKGGTTKVTSGSGLPSANGESF